MPPYARHHQLQGNLIYHIFNRGINRQDIFRTENDFGCFIWILKRYIKKFELKLYHWAIMSNHYHLLLEIAFPERIPSLMSGINRSYTAYHHKNHGTCGYLWQGRYKAQPIQKDQYLLACGRYIERNPVVANITSLAHEYMYSSAKSYILGISDNMTSPSQFFESLGNTHAERQRAYASFLLNFNHDEDVYFDNMEKPMGDKVFLSKLIINRGLLVPRRQGRIQNTIFDS